ncbi:neuromedin-B receptor-like [Montipora foliosa]|uniref:neuromedin-B receptor-like n=1 Tax=Montipora foliosa TaxID=591990 RepID=UPI0035F16785
MAQQFLRNLSYDIQPFNQTMARQQNNSGEPLSQAQLFDPLSFQIMVVSFFSIISAFGFLGNVCLLGTILKWKRLRNPCGLLLANISCADLGMAIIAAPLRIAEMYFNGWPFGSALCRLLPPLQDVMVCVSVVTHSTISLERYRATVNPFKPRLSAGRTKLVILGIWLFCYVFGGLPLTFPLKLRFFKGTAFCVPDWTQLYRRVYQTYLVLFFILVQLVIQSYAYISIITTLKSKSDIVAEVAARTKSLIQSGESFDSPRVPSCAMVARVKRKQKLVKMLLFLVVAFQICHLPRGITMLYREFANPSSIGATFEFIDLVSLALYYLKHVINPFILFAMSADFRNGIVACFKGKEFPEKSNQTAPFRTTRNYALKPEEDDEDSDKNGEDDQL